MYSCQVMNGNAMSMPISRIGHLAGRNIHIKAKVAAAVAIPAVQFCNCQLWIDWYVDLFNATQPIIKRFSYGDPVREYSNQVISLILIQDWCHYAKILGGFAPLWTLKLVIFSLLLIQDYRYVSLIQIETLGSRAARNHSSVEKAQSNKLIKMTQIWQYILELHYNIL